MNLKKAIKIKREESSNFKNKLMKINKHHKNQNQNIYLNKKKDIKIDNNLDKLIKQSILYKNKNENYLSFYSNLSRSKRSSSFLINKINNDNEINTINQNEESYFNSDNNSKISNFFINKKKNKLKSKLDIEDNDYTFTENFYDFSSNKSLYKNMKEIKEENDNNKNNNNNNIENKNKNNNKEKEIEIEIENLNNNINKEKKILKL
jgi:hypothetical protein